MESLYKHSDGFSQKKGGEKMLTMCNNCGKNKTTCRPTDTRKSPYHKYVFIGFVCEECRKQNKGLWRYHKEKKEKIK